MRLLRIVMAKKKVKKVRPRNWVVSVMRQHTKPKASEPGKKAEEKLEKLLLTEDLEESK
jgi:hypothetical protein